jgi:hypothetical protein
VCSNHTGRASGHRSSGGWGGRFRLGFGIFDVLHLEDWLRRRLDRAARACVLAKFLEVAGGFRLVNTRSMLRGTMLR